MTEPLYRSGKICYLEIPADDVEQAAEFYRRAFGWSIRRRGDGAIAFDDTVGSVSGTWVTNRAPARDTTLVVYIMTADAARSAAAVTDAGGEIVQPVDPQSRETYFHFRDPTGNLLGVYQQPGLGATEAG